MTISPSWRKAALVGAGGTLVSLLLDGFHGARWVDAPIIRSFVDPTLYGNDPFRAPFHTATPAAIPHRLFALVVAVVSPNWLDPGLLLIYLPTTLAALALVYAIG